MPTSYKTEVCVSGEWSTNSMRYATRDEAERAGKELLNRWWVPTDSRAAESDDAVNAEFPVGAPRPNLLNSTPIPVAS